MPEISVPGLKDLQGEWRLVAVGKDGNKAPFFVPWLIKVQFQVKRDRYIKIARGNIVERGRIVLRRQPEFAMINEHIEEGCDAGECHHGIIRLIGRKLEHLQGDIGDPRPSGFPYGKDTKASMAIMKRV